jgi:hypothetical protein
MRERQSREAVAIEARPSGVALRGVAAPAKLRTNAAALLPPGEKLQAVIRGQTLNPDTVPITPLRILFGPDNPYRVIIATDRRLLVCRGSRWTLAGIGEVVTEKTRLTRIGPASGKWDRTDSLDEPPNHPTREACRRYRSAVEPTAHRSQPQAGRHTVASRDERHGLSRSMSDHFRNDSPRAASASRSEAIADDPIPCSSAMSISLTLASCSSRR